MTSPFQYINELGALSPFMLRSFVVPYGWGPTPTTNPWSSPVDHGSDRQVAIVSWARVTQGVYICANGGNCTAPGVCACAVGWIGFDCRTPVCTQGYYEPSLASAYANQGLYQCSKRAMTQWENGVSANGKFSGYMHDHPNYVSNYQNVSKGWPTTYARHAGLGNTTNEGWRRNGWWQVMQGAQWVKGQCTPLYDRTCPGNPNKAVDLISGGVRVSVLDTRASYAPRLVYVPANVSGPGRWDEAGGECIDFVQFGCFNNGTCVAPDVCKCAPGWEGHDCSLPVCRQSVESVTNAVGERAIPTLLRNSGVNAAGPAHTGDTIVQFRRCPNRGNCSLPGTCTCEKGWTGADCTTPFCAQDCLRGGTCIAPDVCKCHQWWNTFRDNRGIQARPIFQQPSGDPQFTGWTGFDCNTPICTQALAFVPNSNTLFQSFIATKSDGFSFEAGCAGILPSRLNGTKRTRVGPALCGVLEWYQGSYDQPWNNSVGQSMSSAGRAVRVNYDYITVDSQGFWHRHAPPIGEGIYVCHNNGSCVLPDTCTCPDGWSGVNCNTPLCRHTNSTGAVVSCLNGGICASRDSCFCITAPSLLQAAHLENDDIPIVTTGYTGTDCSIAICVQGSFDRTCRGVPPLPGTVSVSSGVEGCYRCANGGNCTAPDFCTCTAEWQGFDCRTPVCTQVASAATIYDINTVDPAKIVAFENDPCYMKKTQVVNGIVKSQGNCTAPKVCTCLCTQRTWYDKNGELVQAPWIDTLRRKVPPGYRFGTSDCLDGFEGNWDLLGRFTSCHLRIYVPSTMQRYSVTLIALSIVFGFFGAIIYFFVRRRLRQKFLLAKAERRRSRRSSEEASKEQAGAAQYD